MLSFENIDRENAAGQLKRLLDLLEEKWRIRITIHDHKGLLRLPDGRHILPGRNFHQCPCCRLDSRQTHVRLRCLEHCSSGVIRQFSINPAATQLVCWRGLTEVVVPVCRERDHVATFFGGTFRLPGAQLPKSSPPFTEEYRELYRALPEWDGERAAGIALMLQTVSVGIMQIAGRLYEESLNAFGRAGLMKRFIDRYADRDLKLKDLATHLGLSESRTSHLLKESFDSSFRRLLNQERVRRAKALLTGSALSIAEIAEQVGFNNEYYFNRTFRQLTGMPPGAFRRRNRAEP